ncbi:MAG TPA: sulfur carrier protein ThiS [Solirubrobacteraceae bacterium]|nr:sulfur carrier protein ThiS [Solirubrobacteraceae bacterium]
MIFVNGEPIDAGGEPTIRDVLLARGIDPETAGIAVAVDAEVARRGVWQTRTLPDGAHVEIVRAVQGG